MKAQHNTEANIPVDLLDDNDKKRTKIAIQKCQDEADKIFSSGHSLCNAEKQILEQAAKILEEKVL